MFEQLKSWSRRRKQQQPRRPHPRRILNLEALEERWCPAGDTYTWHPGNVNNLASNAANWEKNSVQQNVNGTLPGNNYGDTVQLDLNTSNNPIEWNQNFNFSTMNLLNFYNGDQTIDHGVTLELNGSNGNGSLNGNSGGTYIHCADNTAKLTIDDNATMRNLVFAPSGNGQVGGTLLINGGTTTICNNADYGAVLWGTVQVLNATLKDSGQAQLKLLGTKTTIQVQWGGTMTVQGGGQGRH